MDLSPVTFACLGDASGFTVLPAICGLVAKICGLPIRDTILERRLTLHYVL